MGEEKQSLWQPWIAGVACAMAGGQVGAGQGQVRGGPGAAGSLATVLGLRPSAGSTSVAAQSLLQKLVRVDNTILQDRPPGQLRVSP